MNKDIQQRMKSIRQTIHISTAQKLVASSHIGKARRMLQDAQPYHDRIHAAIGGLLARCPEVASGYLADRTPHTGRRCLIVLSANRGLAGGYNSHVLKLAQQSLAENPAQKVIVLGQAGNAHMKAAGYPVDEGHCMMLEPPSMFSVRELAEFVDNLLLTGEIDSCDIVYMRYKSTVRIVPVEERLFPIEPEIFVQPTELEKDVIFEPRPESVLSELMLKYIKGYLYGCFVHAWTSELASRMMSMDSAIRNGNEILDALTLSYNRARQAAITQEITEIVSGASSLMDAKR